MAPGNQRRAGDVPNRPGAGGVVRRVGPMLTRPVDLSDAALADVLGDGWDLRVTSMTYLPIGAGSHHWGVDDRDGRSWFVTVDDLDARMHDPSESRSMVFERLS